METPTAHDDDSFGSAPEPPLPDPSAGGAPGLTGRPPGAPVRLPKRRWWVALSVSMLAIGVAVGAAIGPAPAASLAGDVPALAQELPLLIARLEADHRASAATASTATTAPAAPPPATSERTPAAVGTEPAKPSSSKKSSAAAGEEETGEKPGGEKTTGKKSKLPAITNVWLVELAGGTFAAATGAEKASAPYINGTLLTQSTLLPAWSAPEASAFASEAVLAEPPVAGATPPLLHSIVQPPCPEASLATCGPETPGQIAAADEFLKAALTTITASATYKEHGLVVITFASVGIPTQSELPAGASTATLSYQPPAGVALLSPFAKAGRSTVAFDTTSPRQSLEKLLH
jgi:hypothetical protein